MRRFGFGDPREDEEEYSELTVGHVDALEDEEDVVGIYTASLRGWQWLGLLTLTAVGVHSILSGFSEVRKWIFRSV